MALLELPRGVTTAELAGRFGLPGAVRLSGRIKESFRRRLDDLPAATRRLLQLAAADPVGEPALLDKQRSGLRSGLRPRPPAVEAGLIEFDPRERRCRRDAETRTPTSPARRRLVEGFDMSLPANQRKLEATEATEALAQLADEAAMSLIQLASAFVLSHPAVTAPIIGPRTMEHLDSQPPATSSSTRRCPTAATKSSRPGPTSTPPTAAGRTPPCSPRRDGAN